VASITGEQFALPDAVALLRETRRTAPSCESIVVSAADPLNLVGTLLPGARIAALTGNRIVYRDGVALAALVAGEVVFLSPLDVREQRDAERALLRQSGTMQQVVSTPASD
jgi:ATP-dependent Lhr-like helicase